MASFLDQHWFNVDMTFKSAAWWKKSSKISETNLWNIWKGNLVLAVCVLGSNNDSPALPAGWQVPGEASAQQPANWVIQERGELGGDQIGDQQRGMKSLSKTSLLARNIHWFIRNRKSITKSFKECWAAPWLFVSRFQESIMSMY